MNDQKLLQKIKKVIKKSRGKGPEEPERLLDYLFDFKQETDEVSYKKIIMNLWPIEWKQAQDNNVTLKFEKKRENLLNKNVNEINSRVFDSELSFHFYLEMKRGQFKIITDSEIVKEKHLEHIQKKRGVNEKQKDELIKKLEEKYFNFKSEDVKNYILDLIKDQFEDYKVQCLPDTTPLVKDLKLDDIYINLKVKETASFSKASTLTEQKAWLAGLQDSYIKERNIVREEISSNPSTLEELIQSVAQENEPSKKRMVFLGPPGSGKTTILRYLAHSIASGKAEKWGLKGFVPLYVKLSDYALGECKGITQYITEKIVEDIADDKKSDEIRKVLKQFIYENKENNCSNSVIFLLDALDETRDKKSKVIEQIENLVRLYNNAFIIVTSRNIDYSGLKDFSDYIVEDIQIEDINGFIRVWFEKLCEEKKKKEPKEDLSDWAKKRISFLLREIDKNQSLRRIASNPLYLTFLVLLASDPNLEILPETRSELYNKYFDELLLKWEEKHELPFSTDKFLDGFKEICWIVHRALFGNVWDNPTIDYIKKTIKNSFGEDTEELLHFWIQTGIFFMTKTKTGDKLILPQHLSFLEYGFACKLADFWEGEEEKEDIWTKLKQNLHNINLQEPLILFIGQLEKPDDFIKRIWNLKDDIFHGNLIFLGKAVNEAKNKLKNKRIIKDLQCRLLELCNSDDDCVEPVIKNILECIGLLGGIKSLIKLFKRKKASFKIEIIDSIVMLGDKSIIPLLKEFYDKEEDSYLRSLIAVSMSSLAKGDKSIIPLLKELYDKEEDSGVRVSIANSIGRRGDSKSDFLLFEKLYDKEKNSPHVYFFISDTIAELGEKLTIPLLKELYNEIKDPDLRGLITVSMGRLAKGDKSIIPFLKELYDKEENSHVRFMIVKSIGVLGGKSTIPFLKELYAKEKDSDVRESIANSIGMLGDKSTIPFLKELYAKEEDSLVRTMIVESVEMLADKSTIPLLKELYDKEENSHVRFMIVKSIGMLGDKSTIPFLKELYAKEKDSDVRISIAYSIGWLGDLKSDILIHQKHCNTGKESYMQNLIAESIDRLAKGGKSIIPFLKELYDETKQPYVRTMIVDSVEMLGDKSTIPLLKKLYDKEKSSYVRISIANSIGRLGDSKLAISLFKEIYFKELYYKEKEYDERDSIANSIGRLGGKSTIPLLKKLYDKEKNSKVRISIARSIYKITIKQYKKRYKF